MTSDKQAVKLDDSRDFNILQYYPIFNLLYSYLIYDSKTFLFQSYRLAENEVKVLKQAHDACQADKKTQCDVALLKKLVDNQNNKQVGLHMLCMAEKAGLMQHNGTLNVDNIKKKVAVGSKPGSAIDGLVTKCARSKNNAETTAVQMWICFMQNDIHYYYKF